MMRLRSAVRPGLATIAIMLTAMFTAAGTSTADTSHELGPAEFYIRSELHGKCLDVLFFNTDNGATAGFWDCNGGANQRWYSTGEQIRSSLHNKCLDVLFFNTDNGAKAGLWDCNGGANQSWYRDGSLLKSRLHNKCLDVLYLNRDNGAAAGLWDCHGRTNQRWYTVPA
ncbi:RICIN domain-containing protein [Actinokineospora sp. NBRC 105648]|uniref:RICIN domain-containing protein n=1 Tax=Actinokineospora sp. NBRC 105648 TaxID=3032206 RepID=UPI0024A4A34B|nr:RICIN domain-containing protein [Actinokineospora sp. NBRC 105648]GLZ43409.1 hypothetical protein Acsp05_70330 [Actinokineospora sp. NBRC 105648]